MKMKTVVAVTLLCSLWSSLSAQEEKPKWKAGIDLVSSYVWRGLYLSNAAVQPSLVFESGGFSAGAWGSASFDGVMEADLFVGYTFGFGLSLGVTDYYFPSLEGGNDYFDISKESGSHIFELNGSYEISRLRFSANWVLNESRGAGSAGGDKYFEVAYAIGNITLFAGGGDGLQSLSGDLKLTNIGISATKELQITPSFQLPVTCSAIFNPDRERLYLVAALAF
ncbi:protein of unknown function (Gcw_chp) [Porphyromonadaceae bacterium KHP3R9]|jgi:hypothetical protein|nr:protein of unknown function (Gcw_chp) [Porphyromonadaceae bacterium KHP3R9]